MAVFQPFSFLNTQGTGFPPVGNYVTSNLAYYFDFGESTSYSGTGTDIYNLAPGLTTLGDAEIWAGTIDQGSKTTSGTTFDSTKFTLQMGGSGGTWNQYSTDQTWFGDVTSPPNSTWPSQFTVEIGYYYQPHNWSGQSQNYLAWGQRKAGPGQWGNLNEVVIGGVAGYNLNPTLTPSAGTAQIVTFVWDNTSLKRYLNGSLFSTTSISSIRKNASPSPFGWGALYTTENGSDRLGNPTWSEYQYVRFYEGKALSLSEVQQNYNANKGRLGLS